MKMKVCFFALMISVLASVAWASPYGEVCYGLYPSWPKPYNAPMDLLCINTWERFPDVPSPGKLPPRAEARICSLSYVMTLNATTIMEMESLAELETIRQDSENKKTVIREYVLGFDYSNVSAFYKPLSLTGTVDETGQEHGTVVVNGRQLFYEKQDWSKYLRATRCRRDD